MNHLTAYVMNFYKEMPLSEHKVVGNQLAKWFDGEILHAASIEYFKM